jgi:hypothetical protein
VLDRTGVQLRQHVCGRNVEKGNWFEADDYGF